MVTILVPPSKIGGDAFEDRIFTEVIFDHVRDIGVGHLVICNSGADGIGQDDVSFEVGFHDARDAEERVLAEDGGVEEVIVDTAVDDIDLHKAAGGAHVDIAVGCDEVATFDDLNAHGLGEERMFEVGAVIEPGREQDGNGSSGLSRRKVFEGLTEDRGVVAYRANSE